MVHQFAALDQTFSALADPTRRAILQRLGMGSATISELAGPAGMSLTGLGKHVRLLEDAGLVRTEKRGRTRRCHLGPKRLQQEAEWIEAYRRGWAERFDRLEEVIENRERGTR